MPEKKINVNRKLQLHFFLLIAAGLIAPFISGPELTNLPTGQAIATRISIGFLNCFLLLFFIPTVMRPTPRNMSWFGFFLLAYLVWSILRLFSPTGWVGGIVITAFNLSTFLYVVRWLRPFKVQSKKNKS
jgi:uncharacterized membrane protein